MCVWYWKTHLISRVISIILYIYYILYMYWSNVRLILEDTLNNSCYRIRVRVITSHYMISVRTRGILCSLDSSLITTKRFTTLPTRTYRLRMSRVDEQLDPLTMLVLESQLKATWSCNFFYLGYGSTAFSNFFGYNSGLSGELPQKRLMNSRYWIVLYKSARSHWSERYLITWDGRVPKAHWHLHLLENRTLWHYKPTIHWP